MEEHQHSIEELEACRRRAQAAALSAGAERAGESAEGSDLSQVSIQFDWEVPSRAHAPIVFEVRVRRGGRESSIRCAIDLDRLETDDLELVHDLLAYRPKGYQLARTITWLLDTSLRQQDLDLSTEDRNRKVRELLLFSPEP